MRDTNAKIEHLKMIQQVITRLAGNLFYLKGWSISLIAALFALASKEENKKVILVAYVILFVFWSLDGYFLSQERLYRALYDAVRVKDERVVDFSMDVRPYANGWRTGWIASIWSRTLTLFYLPIAALLLALLLDILR